MAMAGPVMMSVKIENVTFNLSWDGDIAMMEKTHRVRALKLIDTVRAAGENGAPKERKTRKPRQRGESALEQAAAEAE